MSKFIKDTNKEQQEDDEIVLLLSSIETMDQEECDDIMVQLCDLEKKRKREKALEHWKWDEVVDVLSSDDQDLADEAVQMSDTADSSGNMAIPKKRPRVIIRSRNRCYKLRDEPEEEDPIAVSNDLHVAASESQPLARNDDEADEILDDLF
ncbi:hypothetical protein LXL04_025843 [Taraxacum kok-saghyz]